MCVCALVALHACVPMDFSVILTTWYPFRSGKKLTERPEFEGEAGSETGV